MQIKICFLAGWRDAPEAKMVFVNHGQELSCDEFAKTIENELSIPAIPPYSGDGFGLATRWFRRK